MFGIGMPEMLLILAVALIVIGPKKLPDLAKSLGRALGEFKRATTDLKDSIESETQIGEVKNAFKDLNKDIKGSFDPTKVKTDSSSATAAEDSPSNSAPQEDSPAEEDSTFEGDSSTEAGSESRPDPAPQDMEQDTEDEISSAADEDAGGSSQKDGPTHV